jgi:hypothetical protein
MKRLATIVFAAGLMACHGGHQPRTPADATVVDSFKPPYPSAKFAGQQYTIYESSECVSAETFR